MTLKTSSRKINPFWNMICFTLRKNLGIIIVLCIAALVYYPGTFIINYETLLTRVENSSDSYMVSDFGVAVTFFSAIIAVLFNMLNFGFLYKKSSSDVFHSFPMTRSELLLSRFISGLISTLIPVFVCYTAFGILIAFNSWIGAFSEMLYYLLHTIVITLVCSSFSMIFVVCAGNAFDLGVSLVGGNLALLAVGRIFESILNDTLVGYNGYVSSEIVYNISPPYFCATGLSFASQVKQNGIHLQSIEFFIRSAIYIVAFTVVSLLLYNRRKAEKGGSAYAYKFMYIICALLAGICGGYVLGMMFTGDVRSIAFWIFTAIGCLLTTVVYGAVSNRGFKGVGRSIIIGTLSTIVLVSVAISGFAGGFGFTKRIPEKEKIKSVTIGIFGEEITFDNPQEILDLHNTIIETNATNYDSSTPYQQIQNIRIYYDLENEKTFSRNFDVDSSIISDELLKIYKSDERLKMMEKYTDTTTAEEANLYFYYDGEYLNVQLAKSEVSDFINAYWQDVQNSDAKIFNDENYEFLEITISQKVDDYSNEWKGFQFEWHDEFANTKQFIKDHNLAERSKLQQDEIYDK